MRIRSTVLAVLLVACSAPVSDPAVTTTEAVATTGTAPATTTSTTTAELPIVIDDCAAPQVGFSPLCEVYELVQEWHVDRPLDPETLAEAAMEGLHGFETETTEPVPRTLFCAIPHPAFEPMCDEIAARMVSSGLPIAPAVEAAVQSMGDTGLDPFSYYVPPDLVGGFRANGVVGGVGILLDATDAVGSKCVRITQACPLEIVVVLDDNPGAEAGLETGDVIVSIDGDEVDGLGFVEAATRIAGDETGLVSITVERDQEEIDFTIERDYLVVPTVELDVPLPGTGYLRIPDFETDIPDLVRDALEALRQEQIERLVVDLRDNPGGFLQSAVEVATEFMTGVTVFETQGPGESLVYTAEEGGLATDLPITVLVNAGTASAAEILAAALREQRGAEIIGEPTFGKDAVQIAFELNNGGEFYVAVARWQSPQGTTVAGTGLVPDRSTPIPATMPLEELVSLAFE